MIRPYRPEDLEAVMDIANRAWQSIYDSYANTYGAELTHCLVPDRATAKGEEVRSQCEQHPECAWVHEEDGTIAAFLTFRIDEDKKIGTICNNAVSPEFRGRGIGRQMYRKVLDLFKEKGMRFAKVLTGSDEGHAPARKAYESVGFNIKWPTVNYYMRL